MKRYFNIVMALVILLVTVAPTRPLVALPASQVPFNISASQAGDVVWTQHAMISFAGPDLMERTASTKFMQELYRVAPNLAPDVALNEAQQFTNYYRSVVARPAVASLGGRGSYESVMSFLTDAGHALQTNFASVPSLKFATSSSTTAMRELVRDWAVTAEQAKRGVVDPYYLLETSSLNIPLSIDLTAPLSVDALQGARGLKENPTFTGAFDRQFGAELKVSIRSDTHAVLQADKDLRELFKGLVAQDGSINASEEQLKNLIVVQITRVNEQTTKDQAAVKKVNELQKFIDKYIASPEKRAEAEKYVKERNAEREEILKIARPAVQGLSWLIGLKNKQLARQVETVGMAVIQVADGVGKVLTAIGAITQFGMGAGLLASGAGAVQGIMSIIGGVSSIVSLFSGGESGPTPAEQTMQMIEQLSQQIAALGQHIDERFNRIDAALNQIYSEMMKGFQRMEELLVKVAQRIIEDLNRIKQDLKNIQISLNQLRDELEIRTSSIYELLVRAGKRELLDTTNLYLGYVPRYQRLPDYQDHFIPAQDKVYNWGTVYHYDYGDRDKNQPLTPARLEQQLSGRNGTLDENLTYLARYMAANYPSQDPTESGAFALVDKNPHIGIWAFSSGAYAQLMMELPDYAGREVVYQERLRALASEGEQLERIFRQIALTRDGKAKINLFDRMVAAYKSAYVNEDGLEAWIVSQENAFLAAWNDSRNRELFKDLVEKNQVNASAWGSPPDLWAGAKQPKNYLPKNGLAMERYLPSLIPGCTNSPGFLDFAAKLQQSVPSELLLAHYLGLGTISYCYTQSVTVTERQTCKEIKPKCTPRACDLQIERPPCQDCVVEETEVDCSTSETFITEYNILFNGKSMGKYTEGGTSTLTPEERSWLDQIAVAVNAALQKKQSELYAYISNAITTNPDAAQRLQSARLLLRAMVTLGMPRALGSDEYLYELLFRNDGLLDRDLLAAMYAQAARGEISAPGNVRTDPSTNIKALVLSRADSLAAKLRHYLGMLERKQYVESHPLIESTLNELKLASNITSQRCEEFKATGKCSYGTIAAFWDQNGALPVFGYPTSSILERFSTETGSTYTYQWFERNRLELHPPVTGKPGEILLGLLGVERLKQLKREAEPKVAAIRQPNCMYFEVTGHNVCNQQGSLGFKTYWESHRLLNPNRTDFVNSLMLFGYPITEAKEERSSTDGKVYLTQWFERARFEWHPENRDEFKVLLGLLGNEVTAASP